MEGDSDSVSSDVGGMTAGEVSESYGNFGGSLAESLGAVAESLGSGTGGYDMGGGGSSMADAAAGLQDALGPTDAGMFGMTGPVGVAAGTPGVTDVSTGLSGLGLGDVAMGGFGLGGIQGLGTSPDGVSGLGLGAGNMATGSSFSESLADVIGGNMVGGFGLTGPTSVSPSVSPFGGANIGALQGTQMSPASLGQLGPSFGFTGPANVFAGAAYEGAEVGLLGATGVPGTRANALAEQQSLMQQQALQNPTFEITENMPVQDVVTSLRSGLFSSVPSIPGVPTELSTSTLAVAAAAPVSTAAAVPATSTPTAATPSVAPSQTAQAAPVAAAQAPSPAPTQTATQTSTVSRDVSPAVVAPTATGAPPRSASSFQQEAFADPLTGAQINVVDGVPTVAATQPGWGHTAATIAANTALGVFGGIPGLAAQGASYLGTGQSFGANLADVATGRGFSPPGGILGGGIASLGRGTAVADLGTGSSENGMGYMSAMPQATVAPAVPVAAPVEVISPAAVQRAPVNPYAFNIADFISRPYYSDSLPTYAYRR